MPYPYEHLSRTEREQIAVRRRQGTSRRVVGRELGRAASTIGREIRRNGREDGSYLAGQAERCAQQRRHRPRRPRKLAEEGLRSRVEEGLRAYWSPEQISGRLGREEAGRVSRATIYRHVGAHPEYRMYLRGPDGARRESRRRHPRIRGRTMIDERPVEVERRERVGDWESDTLRGPMRTKACLVTHVERRTRYVVAGWLPEREGRTLNQVTVEAMRGLPVRTLTVDNGMEFGCFRDLRARLAAAVYFAHEGCPWERALNENTNRLLRQFFPRGTDFTLLDPAELRRVQELINNRPRKGLGYQTPKEMMQAAGVALVS
ncbi:MAG: IS30 family transposase [Verrucomicrobiota bacterium]